MPVRTKCLAAVTASGPPAVAYTCPADETAIIKALNIGKFATGAVTLDVGILRGATAYGVYRAQMGIGATVLNVATWIVMQPGDQLRVSTDTLTATVWVSGTELEGVAD